jgi:threonine/homoserine/homoserine lactone efflux protein
MEEWVGPKLALFVAAEAVLLLTPGPAVIYIVTRSVHQGRRAGLVSALGIGVGSLFHIVAATLGLSAILASSAVAFSIVKYLGAGYLIFLGVRRLLGTEKGSAQKEEPEKDPLKSAFTQGILVNVLNPKTALFFLAFLPQFVDPRGPVAAQVLFLGLLFAVMGVASDSAWALAAGTAARRLSARPGVARAQRFVTGGAYIGLGLIAALSGNGRK